MALQPLLHDAEAVVAAPAQAWSRSDGDMRAPVDGLVVADLRVLAGLSGSVAGTAVEAVSTETVGASTIRFSALLRGLDGPGADPRVRLERERVVDPAGMRERWTVRSGRDEPVPVELLVRLEPDATSMPDLKAGRRSPAPPPDLAPGGGATWPASGTEVRLSAEGFDVRIEDGAVLLARRATLAPHGSVDAAFRIAVGQPGAVVAAPAARSTVHAGATGLPDLDAWTARALEDLSALQLALPDRPDEVFVGAGAPWFLTLFGRDALWAARMLLPLDVRIAAGTLRVLARLQGERVDDATGERPGGILHELRRGDAAAGPALLPPRYYGTIDATPLWILLLHDAWRAGLPDDDVAALMPNLRAALGWLHDAVPPGGFLSYSDPSGHGLANQGWKDSADSVQWRDGRLAEGPIALCEVQGYAHEAALAAGVLLDAFDDPAEARTWRAWAADLKARFRAAFWVQGPDGGHPAIALDASGDAVDSLTSNIGHLLGTGLLDAADERRVAALLVDARLDSGNGLRTLATDSAGYWPLSYHGGSVWPHDTAIAVRGLARAGFPGEARRLATGLVRASRRFDRRMPELYSGDAVPVPYPAACRPQAWSAAAAVVVREVLTPRSPAGGRASGATTEPVSAADRPN